MGTGCRSRCGRRNRQLPSRCAASRHAPAPMPPLHGYAQSAVPPFAPPLRPPPSRAKAAGRSSERAIHGACLNDSAAMKEGSLQWVIRRCIRDAMPSLRQLWPVRGEGCPSRFQLMFGAHAGQTETGSPSYVRALSGLQGCPISSEWMRAGVRSTSSFRAAHQDRVGPLPDITLMPPSGAQRQLSLAAYASPHANVCVYPNGKYQCSATQKLLSSPRF